MSSFVFVVLFFVLLFFVPVHWEGIDLDDGIVQQLGAVHGLVEVPAQILAGNFLDRLQEIFLSQDE